MYNIRNIISDFNLMVLANNLSTGLNYYFDNIDTRFSVAERRVETYSIEYAKKYRRLHNLSGKDNYNELVEAAATFLKYTIKDILIHTDVTDVFNRTSEHIGLFKFILNISKDTEIYNIAFKKDNDIYGPIPNEDKIKLSNVYTEIFKEIESSKNSSMVSYGDSILYYTKLLSSEILDNFFNHNEIKEEIVGETLYTIIHDASTSIKNGRDSHSIMHCISSETGELSEEVRKAYSPDFYKEPGKDGILGEGCDVLIGVVDLLINNGYTEEQVMNTIKKKTSKWKGVASNDKK